MSLTSRRNGTGRLYVRRFDHEEAARLRFEEHVPVREIAERYGVSISRVYQVTTPGSKQRLIQYGKRWRTDACESCGGPAMRLIAGKSDHNPDGRRLCKTCRSRERQTRFTRDAEGRILTVRCTTCREWKPRREFSSSRVASEGIHRQCRACQTAARQAYRERRKLPCVGCGKPALPPSEKGRRSARVPRCPDCFHAALREAAKAAGRSRTAA